MSKDKILASMATVEAKESGLAVVGSMNDASKRRLSVDEFDLVSRPDFCDVEEYEAATRDFNAGSSETAPHRPHQGYGTFYIPSTMMHGSGTVVDHWEGDAINPDASGHSDFGAMVQGCLHS